MVATRNQCREAAQRKTNSTLHDTFQRSYKGLTPKQQETSRHNRFLNRVWKVPRSKRNSTCVACLGDFLDCDDPEVGFFGVMACDHAIHLKCLFKHADAHLDRKGVPSLDNFDEVMNMPEEVFNFAETQRLAFRRLGAPCPACRMEFPMRHMPIFDSGATPKSWGIYIPQTPKDWIRQWS